MNTVRLKLSIFLTFSLVVASAQAQSSDNDVEQLEQVFQEEPIKEPEIQAIGADKPQSSAENLNQVRKLEPFKEVIVIQRRYLPKTGRFEVLGNTGVIMNDAFFTNLAFGMRLGYGFSESFGLEAMGLFVSTSEKEVTKDLSANKGVTTQTLVSPENYYGLSAKYSPWYGKLSWLNRAITPFDHYFSLGGGVTNTNQSSSAPTLHLGTGQIFAINKSFALRWDVSWFFYNTSSSVASNTNNSTYNNLYLTFGVSWLFPEAKYR